MADLVTSNFDNLTDLAAVGTAEVLNGDDFNVGFNNGFTATDEVQLDYGTDTDRTMGIRWNDPGTSGARGWDWTTAALDVAVLQPISVVSLPTGGSNYTIMDLRTAANATAAQIRILDSGAVQIRAKTAVTGANTDPVLVAGNDYWLSWHVKGATSGGVVELDILDHNGTLLASLGGSGLDTAGTMDQYRFGAIQRHDAVIIFHKPTITDGITKPSPPFGAGTPGNPGDYETFIGASSNRADKTTDQAFATLMTNCNNDLKFRRTYEGSVKLWQNCDGYNDETSWGITKHMVSFKVGGTSEWLNVANGSLDTQVKNMLNSLEATDEYWIVFHHEPENDKGNPAHYRAMQKQMARLVIANRKSVNHKLSSGHLMASYWGLVSTANSGATNISDWIPIWESGDADIPSGFSVGDMVFEVFGLDCYENDPTKTNFPYGQRSFDAYIKPYLDAIVSYVPNMTTSDDLTWCVQEFGTKRTGQDFYDYMDDWWTKAHAYGKCEAFSWFDSHIGDNAPWYAPPEFFDLVDQNNGVIGTPAPTDVLVPDVDGLTAAAAQTAIEAVGLVYARDEDVSLPYADPDDGLVVEQIPAAQSSAPSGSTVTIRVGNAPASPPAVWKPYWYRSLFGVG